MNKLAIILGSYYQLKLLTLNGTYLSRRVKVKVVLGISTKVSL